jgi:hypothetical protein
MQACKPGSVACPGIRQVGNQRQGLTIYLVRTSQSGSSGLPVPTPGLARGTEPFICRNLFGLSTRKVCRAPSVTLGAVSSYLAVSPFPFRVVYFLWHCLSPTSRGLPVRKYDALCCPDFPLRPDPDPDSYRNGTGGAIRRLALTQISGIIFALTPNTAF